MQKQVLLVSGALRVSVKTTQFLNGDGQYVLVAAYLT